jgi:hypothetical protein
MTPILPRRAFWPAATLFLCAHAQAARPMVVDDASITGTGYCQVESWTQHAASQVEYWAAPACNVGGGWELSAGLGRIGPDGPDGAYRSGIVQAKTVFHPLDMNGWGIGLTLANQFRKDTGVTGDLSVLVPVSMSLFDDRVLLHANLGWLRPHAGGRPDGLWAVGTEWTARRDLTIMLETYGTRRGHGFAQAGMRYTLVPDRLAVDAGVGQRIGGRDAERYYTIGLTLDTPVLR